MKDQLDLVIQALEAKRRLARNGGEYWMGRDIQVILGYAKWDKFENVIGKAKMASESSGVNPQNHFLQTGKMVPAGSGTEVEQRDYFLTRYACYLIAMNGDTSKLEVGTAQTYFAVQTRKQEIQQQLTDDERRLQLRERIRMENRNLAGVAKQSGVQKYAVFQAAGYQGLYEMGLGDIKRKKGIAPHEDLLDRAGRIELAANEFRITQTEDKLKRDGVNSEQQAIETHRTVGQAVRTTIRKLGGKMPEDLPAETSIKKIATKLKKEKKSLTDQSQ